MEKKIIVETGQLNLRGKTKMVLDKEETIIVENLKFENKKKLLELQHNNHLIEFKAQLKIEAMGAIRNGALLDIDIVEVRKIVFDEDGKEK